MKHMKRGDYLSRSVRLPDGQRCVDRTLDLVTEIVGTIQTTTAGSLERTGVGPRLPGGQPMYPLMEGSLEGAVGTC